MTKPARSYDRKLDWAEQHLVKMEPLIAEWMASRPYEVLPGVKEKRQPPVLHFDPKPDPALSYILGDFLYNVRAALDYLISAITPGANRGRINFPIFWEGVWEEPIEGESKKRSDDRAAWTRWIDRVGNIDPDALRIIKVNQPTTTGDDTHHALAVLNRLRNKDTHHRGHILVPTLLFPIDALIDGEHFIVQPEFANQGLSDGAPLTNCPEGAMDVKLDATPAIFIRPGKNDVGGYNVDGLRSVLIDGTRRLLDVLRPYDRRRD